MPGKKHPKEDDSQRLPFSQRDTEKLLQQSWTVKPSEDIKHEEAAQKVEKGLEHLAEVEVNIDFDGIEMMRGGKDFDVPVTIDGQQQRWHVAVSEGHITLGSYGADRLSEELKNFLGGDVTRELLQEKLVSGDGKVMIANEMARILKSKLKTPHVRISFLETQKTKETVQLGTEETSSRPEPMEDQYATQKFQIIEHKEGLSEDNRQYLEKYLETAPEAIKNLESFLRGSTERGAEFIPEQAIEFVINALNDSKTRKQVTDLLFAYAHHLAQFESGLEKNKGARSFNGDARGLQLYLEQFDIFWTKLEQHMPLGDSRRTSIPFGAINTYSALIKQQLRKLAESTVEKKFGEIFVNLENRPNVPVGLEEAIRAFEMDLRVQKTLEERLHVIERYRKMKFKIPDQEKVFSFSELLDEEDYRDLKESIDVIETATLGAEEKVA